MAKRVEALPEEHSGGSYQYSKTWGWWLNTAGDVPGGVANAAVPTVTESWVDRQGGGRKLSTYGDPIFPDPQGPGVCPDRPGLGRLIMLAGLGSR
ncbi:hypothetical protein ACH3XX_42920 [Streptomyces scabiei]|uniref:hypothetical protein n=2 Tax=Streptomyces scabiei TaxID=1930 RepID=UPI00131A9659|nr:hypothetical protein [Streptomyces scabiei]MDX2835738.1 hypothetical protein [Streptomyces scabiei]MDX3680612.1 hypothetical protein [Streptomyces scabiei]